VRPTLAQGVIAGCYTRNIFSDHECRLGLDAQDLLDLVSNSLELLEGRNVLSPQHVPDALRQTETSDWPRAASMKTIRHPSDLLICGLFWFRMMLLGPWPENGAGGTVLPRRQTRGFLDVACFTRSTSSLAPGPCTARLLSEVAQAQRVCDYYAALREGCESRDFNWARTARMAEKDSGTIRQNSR
jgi:hypothetical protein